MTYVQWRSLRGDKVDSVYPKTFRRIYFQIKIYYPDGDRTPDLLNQRQTCYHLSQRGELFALPSTFYNE